MYLTRQGKINFSCTDLVHRSMSHSGAFVIYCDSSCVIILLLLYVIQINAPILLGRRETNCCSSIKQPSKRTFYISMVRVLSFGLDIRDDKVHMPSVIRLCENKRWLPGCSLICCCQGDHCKHHRSPADCIRLELQLEPRVLADRL